MSAVRRDATSSMICASSGVVRRSPAARHCWTAASQPARLKMNVIAGSSPAPSSRSMISGRYGAALRFGRWPPRPGLLAGWRIASRCASRTSSGLTSRWSSSVNRSYSRRPGEHVLPQRHRAVLVDDDLGAAAHLGEPVAELLRVAHRRGQRDDADRLREVDDDLFPDGAP